MLVIFVILVFECTVSHCSKAKDYFYFPLTFLTLLKSLKTNMKHYYYQFFLSDDYELD